MSGERRYRRDRNERMAELQKEYYKKLSDWEKVENALSRPPKPKMPDESKRYEEVQKILAFKKNVQNDAQRDVQKVKVTIPMREETENQRMRRLLRERRKIIAPNGEQVYIPKRAAIKDIYRMLSQEYGFSDVEISGVFVTLRTLERNPNFSGLINRVESRGIENPIRIVKPNTELESSENNTSGVVRNQIGKTIRREDPEVVAAREAFINEIWANKFKEYSKRRREEEAKRKESDKKLQEQMDRYLPPEKKRIKSTSSSNCCKCSVFFVWSNIYE